MRLHPIGDPRPYGFTLLGSVLALDPGLSLDPTGLAAARVGKDHGGALRVVVDLLCEMPSPVPPEACIALVEWALSDMWRSLRAEPLVVIDVSNNLALLSLLGRILPYKRLLPLSITAGETSGAAPGLIPVVTTDGKLRHLPKWSVARNQLLGQLDALGSTGAIVLPDPAIQPDVGVLRAQMQATSVEVTASGRRRLVVPARVHDDVLMATAMLAWVAPMALRHGDRRHVVANTVSVAAWT